MLVERQRSELDTNLWVQFGHHATLVAGPVGVSCADIQSQPSDQYPPLLMPKVEFRQSNRAKQLGPDDNDGRVGIVPDSRAGGSEPYPRANDVHGSVRVTETTATKIRDRPIRAQMAGCRAMDTAKRARLVAVNDRRCPTWPRWRSCCRAKTEGACRAKDQGVHVCRRSPCRCDPLPIAGSRLPSIGLGHLPLGGPKGKPATELGDFQPALHFPVVLQPGCTDLTSRHAIRSRSRSQNRSAAVGVPALPLSARPSAPRRSCCGAAYRPHHHSAPRSIWAAEIL
jgi:hypothetical protein